MCTTWDCLSWRVLLGAPVQLYVTWPRGVRQEGDKFPPKKVCRRGRSDFRRGCERHTSPTSWLAQPASTDPPTPCSEKRSPPKHEHHGLTRVHHTAPPSVPLRAQHSARYACPGTSSLLYLCLKHFPFWRSFLVAAPPWIAPKFGRPPRFIFRTTIGPSSPPPASWPPPPRCTSRRPCRCRLSWRPREAGSAAHLRLHTRGVRAVLLRG